MNVETSLSPLEVGLVGAISSVAVLGAMIPFERIAITGEKSQLGSDLDGYLDDYGVVTVNTLTSTLHSAAPAAVAGAINATVSIKGIKTWLVDRASALGLPSPEESTLLRASVEVASSLPITLTTLPLKQAVYLTDRVGLVDGEDSRITLTTPLRAIAKQASVGDSTLQCTAAVFWPSLGYALANAVVFRTAYYALRSASQENSDSTEVGSEEADAGLPFQVPLRDLFASKVSLWGVTTAAALLAYPLDTLRRRAIVRAYVAAKQPGKEKEKEKESTTTGGVGNSAELSTSAQLVGLWSGSPYFVAHTAIQACVGFAISTIITAAFVVARNRKMKENDER